MENDNERLMAVARVIEGISGAILVTDASDNIIYASPAAGSLLELDPASLSGQNFWDVHPSFDPGIIFSKIYSRHSHCVPFTRGTKSLLAVFTAQKDPGSGFVCFIFEQSTDDPGSLPPTEFEEELRLRALEAIGRFGAKLGHDFNNIFGSIRGCLDLMKRKIAKSIEGENPVQRQLDILESALQRGIDLTSKIRGYVRPGNLQKRPGKLSSAVTSTVGLLIQGGFPREGIDVNLSSDPDVEINEFSVSQMLMSLCVNSIEAMASLSERQIILYLEEVNLTEEFGKFLPAGKYARLSVMDHGVGLDEAYRERVFEPFFTTKSSEIGKGIGLSLAMAREIMHKHGGDVVMLSEKECGTVVHLFFPVYSAPES